MSATRLPGWDCHAYTVYFREAIVRMGLDFHQPVEPATFSTAVEEMRDLMRSHFPQQPALAEQQPSWAALQKMVAREAAGSYVDPDLDGQSVARILVDTWRLVRSAEVDELFVETLTDIGQTCMQGDSHRLLALFIALYNSEPV